MNYNVNEIFYSLQGEGKHTGRATLFVRLAGCNLQCFFCDTDHKTKMEIDAVEIVKRTILLAPQCKFVVITGGEPLIQNLQPLINLFHDAKFFVAIESNGTIPLPQHINLRHTHHTVSPKEGHELSDRLLCVNEMKFIVTDTFNIPFAKKCIAKAHVVQVYLQPQSERPEMLAKAIRLIKEEEPTWKLSIQTQKILNIS